MSGFYSFHGWKLKRVIQCHLIWYKLVIIIIITIIIIIIIIIIFIIIIIIIIIMKYLAAYTANNYHVLFRDIAQVNDRSLVFPVCYVCVLRFVYDVHDYELGNTTRCQAPAFHNTWNLRFIHIWSLCETLQHRTQENITHWWSNMYRSVCHKTFSWWQVQLSFRMSFIFIMRQVYIH